MNITIQKKHTNKIIYGLPTGNNRRRGAVKIEPIPFMVVKVKNKYAELKRGDSPYTDNYCLKTGATQSQINGCYTNNAGYIWFECLDDIENYQDFISKKESIRKFFNGNYRLVGISTEDIESIYLIISKY